VDPAAAPFGAAHCGLSARIDARAYVAALAVSVGGVEGGHRLMQLENGTAVFDNDARIAARHIVLATGAEAFRHLPDADGEPAGRGEKGQAAVLRLREPVGNRPILYLDGTYVVPREDGTVAVGATSERHYDDVSATDTLLDAKIAQAYRICPALEGAETIERWAAARPRAADRGLLVGRHPALDDVSIATGGFKTGLAMAHTLDWGTLA
jgi:glycine/D-amino acid oxidase-like deaminating enzyme